MIKTVTYRMIVTGLDFTTNVLVPGDAGIAAGLSSIPLIAGPIFYFVHETAWNYWGGPVSREGGRRGTAVELPIPLLWRTEPKAAAGEPRRVAINRSLAKTITFRTLASTMDFTANYLVVGDLATAVGLTAVGFVLGPFVYLGHEMAWERIGVGEDWRGRGLACPARRHGGGHVSRVIRSQAPARSAASRRGSNPEGSPASPAVRAARVAGVGF